MTGLPRRPYVPEPLPMDGLQEVRREASRRRRVRTVRVSAGGAATAAAAAALVVALTGANGGADTLKPLPPAVGQNHTTSPAPTPAADRHESSVAPAAGPRTTSAGTSPAGSTPRGGVVARGQAASPAADNPAPSRAAAAQSQPQLHRWRSSFNSAGGARLCGGGTTSDDTGFHNGVGWCPSATAGRVSDGVRLTFQLCRDATSGGKLSFSSSREVDLVLRHDGHVVWSWADVRPGRPDSHVLSTPANGCWNWSLVWPGKTSAGTAAPRGDYTMFTTSTSFEVSNDPATTAFVY